MSRRQFPLIETTRDSAGGRNSHPKAHRHAFTLIQLLVVLMVLGALVSLLLGTVSRARARTHSAICDHNMKAIALALDAYRQETGAYPANLNQLVTAKYISDASLLHCPDDPRPNGSYAEYYAMRAPHDDASLPILTCPFHEKQSQGAQAFLGRYTTRYTTAPAILVGANAVTIQHPDNNGPLAAAAGIELHGGDRLTTGNLGSATIQFQDGSTASLQGGCDVTVLQSFVDGQNTGPLYSLIKQVLGTVNYQVHHGSKFDVVTPTATAGARGTQFQIRVDANGRTNLLVTDGTVTLTTPQRTGVAPNNQWITDLNILNLPGLNNLLNNLL